ncbi:hypothetical protein [Sphaerisporangium perillae]|uniref:hypothetical protein n=1 Tax=Sphaerisporangium perillae TaxID=2935860 RepID=UPI00200C07CB|nr:hypothetical protein [Sphaerisporangium perillae]
MCGQAALGPLLLVSGLAQAADAMLGLLRRVPGVVVTAGVLAVLHLLSAWWIAAS